MLNHPSGQRDFQSDPDVEALLAELEALDSSTLSATISAPARRPQTFLDRFKREAKIASKWTAENRPKVELPQGLTPSTPRRCLVRALTPTQPLPSHTPQHAPRLPWERATSSEKFAHAINTAQAKAGLAINLNLSADRENALLTADDPARVLSDRINRALKDAGCGKLPYGFQLEVSPEGRLHLHGIIVAGNADLGAIKRALLKAGGKLAGRAASRQVKLTPITDATGWAGYVTKSKNRTARALDCEKLTFLSADLRSLTRENWQGLRRSRLH